MTERNQGKFLPGQSGNPNGRPRKGFALSEILRATLKKNVELPDGEKISGNKLVAHLITEAITTGQVQFPNDEKPSTIGVKDWLTLVQWMYQYLDPPVTKQEHSGTEGNAIIVKVLRDGTMDEL